MTTTTLERDAALEAQLAKELGEILRGEVRAFQRVTSTMDVAHELAEEGKPEGTLVWSLRQTKGRGRLGRVWESPEGGLYLSLIVRPERPAADVPQLSLIAGLAVGETIRECALISPRVRWPNDVLVSGKKIAGVLTEAKNGVVVIGIGINVSTDPAHLPNTASSLAAAGGKHLEPFHLTARLYRRFFRWYDVWARDGFAPIREALRPQMALFGELVHIRAGPHRFEGTASDVDEAGRLVVRLDSGVTRQFEVGEVTLLQQQGGTG